MKIDLLSSQYKVTPLEEKDIPQIFQLCQGNPLFYQYCPPELSTEGIRSAMTALPAGKEVQDKYYIGFYQDGHLAAVMDFISSYPDDSNVFIGFFMLAKEMQHKGLATRIIEEACGYWKACGFKKVRLGYAKGNPQSEGFWLKNRFEKADGERTAEGYTIVLMERLLQTG
ncbi:MAG: GNAT family N-acetyltransferase [Anaerolineaceae bacterium]|nr:GNAT family N-acetyltransferase [Anaerolineaceae bacterium]